MRAISMWQPWASLWLTSAKIHETRQWSTDYRGWLLVHATQKIVFELGDDLEEIVDSEFGPHWGLKLPRGQIIGAVNLVDCKPTEDVTRVYRHEDVEPPDDLLCGDFTPGRFAWERREVKVFRAPVRFRGRQKWFTVPDELVPEALAA